MVRSPQFLVAVLLVAPLIAATVYLVSRPRVEVPGADAPLSLELRDRWEVVGGVRRPASDVSFGHQASDDDTVPVKKNRIGVVPLQKPDANPQVSSVHQALVRRNKPQRLSPIFVPAPFDRDAYQADPQAYLSVHEPGRVFQSAQPGPGVPVLTSISARRQTMRQGEAVRLSVKTLPGMPVTMTSFDLGIFSNGLTSITVAADEQGIASASFTGSSGTAGSINVLAASPVAAERVQFNVFVNPPADRGE
ncbi:MAG: hypothetical protein MI861_04755 [Pirellulales bacterium]|nr:hypothetical protein [Pirellulales bacterium]